MPCGVMLLVCGKKADVKANKNPLLAQKKKPAKNRNPPNRGIISVQAMV